MKPDGERPTVEQELAADLDKAEDAAPASVSRDSAFWAKTVKTLRTGDVPDGAINLNVAGRRVTNPTQGFGRMWQKTYDIALEDVDVTPQEVVRVWKQRFGEFWPRKNWFYGSLEGINPGDVAVLNLTMFGWKVSTGVLVLYADDEAFTVMTPEGHQFAGFNTFSAYERDGVTHAKIEALIRGSDPVYETALLFGGHRMEDKFWKQTLRNLAGHFGAPAGDVDLRRVCVDRKRQWHNARNVWQNAVVRSVLYTVTHPFGRRATARS